MKVSPSSCFSGSLNAVLVHINPKCVNEKAVLVPVWYESIKVV